jgi:Tol biopolymer transport system component
MAELKEVFEMVTKQTEPDLDSWQQQERRQRSATRNRRIGAIVVAAAAVVGIALAILAGGRDRTQQPLGHPTPSTLGGGGALPAYATPQHLIVRAVDGTAQREIVGLPFDAHALDLAPDGRTIAFTTYAKGADRIATIGLDGQGLALLAAGDQPAWSPDGTQIAFQQHAGVAVMAADGTHVRQLTSPGIGYDEYPRWSPDGTTIVYDNTGAQKTDDSGFSPTSEIMTVPASGGTSTRLTRNHATDSQPDYSPDGRLIAFQEDGHIELMGSDGTVPIAVTRGCCDFTPRWSPSGDTIAYTKYDENWGRPVTSLDGTYSDLPVVVVHLVNAHTNGAVSFPRVGMVTDSNWPVWVSDRSLLLMEVEHP